MIHVFWEIISPVDPYLRDEIHRFRHEVFVKGLGWAALEKPDGREIDQFDDEHAIHVVDIVGSQVCGYSRLLPTCRPHLLSHVYPELLQGRESPRSSATYEWTRLAARKDVKTRDSYSIRRIMAAIPDICATFGLQSLIAQSDPLWIRRLMKLGWDVKPLAPAVAYAGRAIVPLEARVTAETSKICCRVLGMRSAIVFPPISRGEVACR